MALLRDGLEADLGERFDCALANLYVAGGSAACAWHRDPEHGDSIDGAKWARPTFVVSAGETRRFPDFLSLLLLSHSTNCIHFCVWFQIKCFTHQIYDF